MRWSRPTSYPRSRLWVIGFAAVAVIGSHTLAGSHQPEADVRCSITYCPVKTESVLSRLTEIRPCTPMPASAIVLPTHLDPELIEQLRSLGCIALNKEQKWGTKTDYIGRMVLLYAKSLTGYAPDLVLTAR